MEENTKDRIKETNHFNKVIILTIVLLILSAGFFLYKSYFTNTPKESDIESLVDMETDSTNIKREAYANTNYEEVIDETIQENIEEEIIDASTESNEMLSENTSEDTNNEDANSEDANSEDVNIDNVEDRDYKGVYHISSENPTGYYILVGSFKNYDNALKLQNKNPTDFKCYIFEPNENDMQRVGLYVSSNNLEEAKMKLNKIKEMQKNSWLVFNTNH